MSIFFFFLKLQTSEWLTATLPPVKTGLGYKMDFSHTNHPGSNPAEVWDIQPMNSAEKGIINTPYKSTATSSIFDAKRLWAPLLSMAVRQVLVNNSNDSSSLYMEFITHPDRIYSPLCYSWHPITKWIWFTHSSNLLDMQIEHQWGKGVFSVIHTHTNNGLLSFSFR